MNLSTIIVSASLIAAVGLTGCTYDSTHSNVPDVSDGTKAKATVIRDDAQRHTETIDRDLEQRMTALAFRTTQIEEKSKQAHEQIAIDLNSTVQPFLANQVEAKAVSSRECLNIDQEIAGKTSSATAEEANRIKADMEYRKVQSQNVAAAVVADNDKKIAAARAAAAKQIAEIDENDAREKAVILKDRTDAQRVARENRLAVSVDTTSKLDALGEKSAERRSAEAKQDAAADNLDQRITAAVHKQIDNQDAARDVSVVTKASVVTLSGVVSNDAIRQDIVSKAGQITGVVSVDNRLSLR